MSLKKSDSGFSDSGSSIQSSSYMEQILAIERTYHDCLKEFIIKYSRPLRRYLHPNEIVDLFQNIEKVKLLRIFQRLKCSSKHFL